MEDQLISNFQISPIPADKWLNFSVNIDLETKIFTAIIKNQQGKELSRTTFFFEKGTVLRKLNVSHLNNGFYFLEIKLETISRVKQFIISR